MLINAYYSFAVLTHQNNMSVTTTVQPATESLSRHGWVVLNILIFWKFYVYNFGKGFLFCFQQFFVTRYCKFSKNNVGRRKNFANHLFLFYLRMVNIFQRFIKLSENARFWAQRLCIFFYDIVDLQFKFVENDFEIWWQRFIQSIYFYFYRIANKIFIIKNLKDNSNRIFQ